MALRKLPVKIFKKSMAQPETSEEGFYILQDTLKCQCKHLRKQFCSLKKSFANISYVNKESDEHSC